ncbi:minor tail protein T [Escherichia coli]|uniref:Minor tail protein T n=1 Tax=Escherichia coli TaxID=562 RepID=A0A376U7Y0_ECOLX|nr:minor tail protein T [Escherichia coli]
MHFSGLTYAVLSLFFCDPDMHPLISVCLPRREEAQTEMPDEEKMLMQKAQDLPEASGLVGTEGVRFYRLRMWRMSARMMSH